MPQSLQDRTDAEAAARAINDPKAPKIVCLANNPMKANVYSPIFSLYPQNGSLQFLRYFRSPFVDKAAVGCRTIFWWI
jgi:hypothetical protein